MELWEFAGGGTSAGETTVQSAVRELKEETGIITSESDLKLLATYAHKNYFQDIYILRKDIPLEENCANQFSVKQKRLAQKMLIFRL